MFTLTLVDLENETLCLYLEI